MSSTVPASAAPAPAQPRRRSWKVAVIIVSLLLVFSVVANLVMFIVMIGIGAAAGGDSSMPADRVVAEKIHDGSGETIAIMPVAGDVDESMTDRVYGFCEYIKRDPHIKGVVLEVDSPGGGITASDEIHHLFTNLKGTGRRVVVSMRSLAASGGYYVSAPADKIYAQPTTLTGSIGVIWPAFEVSEMMKKVGVTPEIIKSTSANEYKDAGSPFRPFTDKDRDYIRGLVNSAQVKFSAVVDAGRKGKLKKPIAEIAIGKIFTADEALNLGLVDEIAYLDEVCDKTAADLGLANPTIIRLKEKEGLLESLIAKTPVGSPKVELKVDPKLIEQLAEGRMEYRAPEIQ